MFWEYSAFIFRVSSPRRRRRTVWKGKLRCVDEGSAFRGDIGNCLPGNTASSGNLNLQQHCCDTEISVVTVGEHGALL
jgi:hypothetical protein